MLKKSRYIAKARVKKNPIKELDGKIVLGLIEEVTVIAPDGKKKNVLARIDTGATTSSVDVDLAATLKMGPIIKSKLIKSASGSSLRPVIEGKLKIKEVEIETELTIADRSEMKYQLLIGQNILEKARFIIDPKENDSQEKLS